MKVFIQVVAVCLFASAAFAAKGPVAEPVCDEVCPDDFPIKDNWHLPYTGDCSKFCHCANDGNWKKDCPAGLHFNAKLQVCDWPHAAGCDGAADPSDPSDPSGPSAPEGCDGQTCGVEECKNWANSKDCQLYCDCNHGTITVHKCSDGLFYNPLTGDCDYEENVECVIEEPQVPGCEHVSCNEHDCEKNTHADHCSNMYCQCDHGNVTIGHCSEGLQFNPDTKSCDFPSDDCVITTTTEHNDDTTTESNITDPPAPTGECENICPDIYPVVANDHKFPGDCTKFCHCANDGKWLKDCPEGLHFNEALEVCDWPQDAGCVD